MSRGQSEYIGATVLVILTVLVAYVSAEWISTIASIARDAINDVENARETLDVHLEDRSLYIANKGTRRSHIDLIYIEFWNRTIAVKEVDKPLSSGQKLRIDLYASGIEKVCVETKNGNTFCSYRVTGTDIYRGFMSFERIPPTYLGSSTTNHIPYRAKRVIAPETYLYIYATPKGNATIMSDSDDVLSRFPIHIGVLNTSDNYIAITLYNYTSFDIPKLVDHDDSTAGITMWSTTAILELCINFGETSKGWFYIYMVNRGLGMGAYMHIVASNSTCTDSKNHIVLYEDVIGRNVRGVWLVNAKSIKIHIDRLVYDVYSLEFYPYTTTKTSLSFPSTRYSEPIDKTISVFTLSNTYIQMIELITLPTPISN